MSALIDGTHEASLRSWVSGANDHSDFPIQNLPLGIFSPGDADPRAGTAIGDGILDLRGLARAGLLDDLPAAALDALAQAHLNAFLALGPGPRRALRARLSGFLRDGAPEAGAVEDHLHPATGCTLRLPSAIGDYTDFYVGIHHATNVGRQFRPDSPLMPNYKWVPIGYHGRASSVVVSGTPVRRPNGQRKRATEAEPSFGPSRNLDYELEFGIWVGPGNALGTPIAMAQAVEHIAGYCLLNDWSARDIQGWEYQPLGPFLAKSFATTVSPWIVTPEALAPFRRAPEPRPEGDPAPLSYLSDEEDRRTGALAVTLEAQLLTARMREAGLHPARIALSDARHMYWTAAQLVTHHASGGCNLRPGDLLGSGTLSAPDPSGHASLLEATNGGREPLRLSSGEERRFLEDGDEIVLTARCRRDGYAPIGFGACRGTILPAL